VWTLWLDSLSGKARAGGTIGRSYRGRRSVRVAVQVVAAILSVTADWPDVEGIMWRDASYEEDLLVALRTDVLETYTSRLPHLVAATRRTGQPRALSQQQRTLLAMGRSPPRLLLPALYAGLVEVAGALASLMSVTPEAPQAVTLRRMELLLVCSMALCRIANAGSRPVSSAVHAALLDLPLLSSVGTSEGALADALNASRLDWLLLDAGMEVARSCGSSGGVFVTRSSPPALCCQRRIAEMLKGHPGLVSVVVGLLDAANSSCRAAHRDVADAAVGLLQLWVRGTGGSGAAGAAHDDHRGGVGGVGGSCRQGLLSAFLRADGMRRTEQLMRSCLDDVDKVRGGGWCRVVALLPHV